MDLNKHLKNVLNLRQKGAACSVPNRKTVNRGLSPSAARPQRPGIAPRRSLFSTPQ